jgi:hypothetical protein
MVQESFGATLRDDISAPLRMTSAMLLLCGRDLTQDLCYLCNYQPRDLSDVVRC